MQDMPLSNPPADRAKSASRLSDRWSGAFATSTDKAQLDKRPTQWPFERPARDVSIGKAADLAGTTVRALRHYEDLGLLAPRRSRGNMRLYSKEQIDQACVIVGLRRFGVGLQEIMDALRPEVGGDRRAIARLMSLRLDELKRQQADLEAALSVVL